MDLLLLASSLLVASGAYMDCGNVELCGVLTLETGLGRGPYNHPDPSVHGLWPQVGHFGSSRCVKPEKPGDEHEKYSCYKNDGNVVWFERHEWTTHGMCAGSRDEDDFFGQVCSLSEMPLQLMRIQKGNGFAAMVDTLKSHGLPVYSVDFWNKQILLSACASSDGRWHLATVADFPNACSSSPQSPSSPSPPPSPPVHQGPSPSPRRVNHSRRRHRTSHRHNVCVPNQRGPHCRHDGDCVHLAGCVRCAHSGYCTNQVGSLATSPWNQFGDKTFPALFGIGTLIGVGLFVLVRTGHRSWHAKSEVYLQL